MVCLGNICRSPVAEGILRHKLIEKNIQGIETDSAGTSAYHIGEAPDSRMLKAARQNGIDISDLRARQFISEDFGRFDLIFAMDTSNYDNIIALAGSEEEKAKVKLILDEFYPGEEMEVPDPYFGGDAGFQHVIDLLDEAIECIIEKYCE